MPIVESTGDMFSANHQLIVNPVNCVGVMGKGLALEFKSRHPDLYIAYKKDLKEGSLGIGKLTFFRPMNADYLVANFPTKVNWRDSSKLVFIKKGLSNLLLNVLSLELQESITDIGLPALGCGLGGLDYDIVKKEIDSTFCEVEDSINVTVYLPK